MARPTQPIAKNTKVTVITFTRTGRPTIEGSAWIKSHIGDNLYSVVFEGECVARNRLVFGGVWQEHPKALIAQLIAHWRVGICPALLETPFPAVSNLRSHTEGGR